MLGLALFQLANRELKLVDVTIQLLRGTTKTGATQGRELRFQMFDVKCLGVNLVFEELIPALQRLGKSAEFSGIIRERTQRTSHDYLNQNTTHIATKNDDRYLLLCNRRALRNRRYKRASPIDALHQHRELSLR